jgi:renalase
MAGLSAALRLGQAGHAVTVFEANPRLGGRVRTERHGAAQFDSGAQFFRTETPAAASLVLDELPAGGLVDIAGEVRPFTSDGSVGDGDPAQNEQPKWVYRGGIGQLAFLIAKAAGATVHCGWPVQSLAQEPTGWAVAGLHGRVTGFDAAVVTAPPRAAAALIELSAIDTETRDRAMEGLLSGRHRPILSIAFGLAGPLASPGGAYALVNSDRGHTVSWLAFEERKAGYVPGGLGVLVAQMASQWSEPRRAALDREVAMSALAEVTGLVGGHARTPLWWEVTRWREALPDALLDRRAFAAAEAKGLFFAGDGFRGGRANLAIEDGLAAGARVSAWLEERLA